jgi:hypothetical protein
MFRFEKNTGCYSGFLYLWVYRPNGPKGYGLGKNLEKLVGVWTGIGSEALAASRDMGLRHSTFDRRVGFVEEL